jgi:hypothetical protein
MITLHRRSDGAFLTTIETATVRSWTINERGQCMFAFSLTEAKSIRKYMGSRNLIHINHTSLPAWAGVIETDEKWNDGEEVEYTAWSAESLLMSRCPDSGLISAGSPGALYTKLINLANEREDLLIRCADIYQGGGDADTTLDGSNLFEVIQDMAKRRKLEFSILPKLSVDNSLSFTANLYQRQGSAKGLILQEGYNIRRTGNVLRTQRRVINSLTGNGDNGTESRPTYTETDLGSVGLYGLMEGVQDYSGVTELATVQAHVSENLKTLRYPRRTFNLVALDVDNTFAALRLGNVLRLKAKSFGWDGDGNIGTDTTVRILGMRYFDLLNECELTVDEVV